MVDEKNQKIAVQLDIDTFKKIEDLLENHVLAQMIKDSTNDESYDIHKAKAYYKQLTEKK